MIPITSPFFLVPFRHVHDSDALFGGRGGGVGEGEPMSCKLPRNFCRRPLHSAGRKLAVTRVRREAGGGSDVTVARLCGVLSRKPAMNGMISKDRFHTFLFPPPNRGGI